MTFLMIFHPIVMTLTIDMRAMVEAFGGKTLTMGTGGNFPLGGRGSKVDEGVHPPLILNPSHMCAPLKIFKPQLYMQLLICLSFFFFRLCLFWLQSRASVAPGRDS